MTRLYLDDDLFRKTTRGPVHRTYTVRLDGPDGPVARLIFDVLLKASESSQSALAAEGSGMLEDLARMAEEDALGSLQDRPPGGRPEDQGITQALVAINVQPLAVQGRVDRLLCRLSGGYHVPGFPRDTLYFLRNRCSLPPSKVLAEAVRLEGWQHVVVGNPDPRPSVPE